MQPSCLDYQLTAQEKKQFEEEGYFYVENALSPEQVKQLTEITDGIHAEKLDAGHPTTQSFFYPNFIPAHPKFVDLVDYEKIIPKVWDILGWNIYSYHSHLIVTPPTGKTRNDNRFGWHQDSGRVNREMESMPEDSPRPRLSIKVAYFLSDASEEGRGNFWIIPGSHLKNTIENPQEGTGQPEGAIPVKVKPGTAVFFDRRLWHAASPNWSEVTRKVLFYGYSYRWLRSKDEMTVEHLWEQSDPIRRQLLGAGLNANGYYTPTDGDVPLKVWLEKHAPEKVK